VKELIAAGKVKHSASLKQAQAPSAGPCGPASDGSAERVLAVVSKAGRRGDTHP